jgi:DNA-directed RNA polymerase specialized sigma24 family protein
MMSPGKTSIGPLANRGQVLATTNWSIVLRAGRRTSATSDAALTSLYRTYWYPLYAYCRRWGHSTDQAQDDVQDFFAYLMEKKTLAAADPERGRFRTFLLTVFQRFLGKHDERSRTRKRGSGRKALSLDVSSGEERYRREPSHELTPEKLYERRWALLMLESVLGRLEKEYAVKGKADLYRALCPCLSGDAAAPAVREIAVARGQSVGAVKVAIHRLRSRYRQLLRDEIAQTVDSPEEFDDEIKQLLSALRPDAH